MKIYKGDAGIELTVQAFLDILEEDMIDDVLYFVDVLYEESLAESQAFESEMKTFTDEELSDIFEHIAMNEVAPYETVIEDELDGYRVYKMEVDIPEGVNPEDFNPMEMLNQAYLSGNGKFQAYEINNLDELPDWLKGVDNTSAEDVLVKRIFNKFKSR